MKFRIYEDQGDPEFPLRCPGAWQEDVEYQYTPIAYFGVPELVTRIKPFWFVEIGSIDEFMALMPEDVDPPQHLAIFWSTEGPDEQMQWWSSPKIPVLMVEKWD